MVNWVVDQYIFESGRVPKELFEELGYGLYEYDYIPFLTDKADIPFSEEDEPVIVYSTINAARRIPKFYGHLLNEELLNCNVYMSLLEVDSKDFLNHDHLYCTFQDLERDYDYYYDLFQTNALFFRPNAGVKEFTGSVIFREHMMRELDAMKQMYHVSPQSMLLVSTPKKLLDETRFLIGNNEIIDYSRYQIAGHHKIDNHAEDETIEFVENFLNTNTWQPAELYCLDVARTPEGVKIIELNSFSCSGWYAMNTRRVIQKVSELIQNNYNKEVEDA